MLSSLQQKAVWDGWLSSEIRFCYFADLTGRHQRKQRFLTWTILVFSCGSFAAIIYELPGNLHWVRALAALATAGLSLWSLTAKNERLAIDCSDLSFKWNVLSKQFERLWDDMYADAASKTLTDLDAKEAELSKTGTTLPYDKKLMLKWEDYVKMHHREGT